MRGGGLEKVRDEVFFCLFSNLCRVEPSLE